MKTIRCLCAAIMLASVTFLTPVWATSYSTDQSDLWYISAESGWGIQLVQRGNLIFFTMFVYDPAGKPIWYVGTIYPTTTSLQWSGDMYVTTGPWLGAQPYNPALFGGRIVGTLTWTAPFVESGTVSYSVDGVFVNKNVVRQLLVYDNFNGVFVGGAHQTSTSCFNPLNNGTAEFFAGLNVVQNGTNVSLESVNQQGGSCTFVGTLSQGGQFGKMVGNYNCTSGEVGTFNMFEMNVGYNALTARYVTTSTNNGCQSTGYLGGIRHR